MTDAETAHADRRHLSSIDRRAFLAGLGGGAICLAGVGTSAGVASAQEENQATRELIIEGQGDPWTDNYAGQFIIVTYRPDDGGNPPDVTDHCEVEWSSGNTATYRGILVDRIREDPQKQELQLYTDGTQSPIERGTPFIISRASSCDSGYLRLTSEAIPNVQKGEDVSGPNVEDVNETTDDTDTGTGMPGFGALVALGGLGAGLAARAIRGDESDE